MLVVFGFVVLMTIPTIFTINDIFLEFEKMQSLTG